MEAPMSLEQNKQVVLDSFRVLETGDRVKDILPNLYAFYPTRAGETKDGRKHEADKSSEWRGRFSEHHQAD
jgi:hypothetical protein